MLISLLTLHFPTFAPPTLICSITSDFGLKTPIFFRPFILILIGWDPLLSSSCRSTRFSSSVNEWTWACLSVTYPSPSFAPFLFLFREIVHTPSPLFPPAPSPINCFIPVLTVLSPLPLHSTYNSHRTRTPRYLFYSATPLPRHLNYILYFLSTICPNTPDFAL